jgi:acetylornithine deacetylase/succinyl-diaminopimelate desuccinylase-like protein
MTARTMDKRQSTNMTPSQALPAVLQKIDAGLDQSLERLFEFLRIQSISTDPAYNKECQAAAAFVAKDLSGIGFQTSIRQTEGHPIVVGKGGGAGNGKSPRVLFYGHYDVQPVDPLDLWDTPPFTPRIAVLPDGRKIIVARGACDDKGQVMTFVEACRAFVAVTGELPLPITMMIEGEYVGSGDPHGDDIAARARLRGGETHLRRPRPAFRLVRRCGPKPVARACAHPGRHA